MAEASGVVDVGRAIESPGLLRRKVDLVGDPSGREPERRPVRIHLREVGPDLTQGLVPTHRGESGFPPPTAERDPHPTERSEHLGPFGEPTHVCERFRVERLHRVQLEKVEPNQAQVGAVDRPVPKACRAEGAAVADPLGEYPVGVAEAVAVSPGDLTHLEVVVRLDRAYPRTLPPGYRCMTKT